MAKPTHTLFRYVEIAMRRTQHSRPPLLTWRYQRWHSHHCCWLCLSQGCLWFRISLWPSSPRHHPRFFVNLFWDFKKICIIQRFKFRYAEQFCFLKEYIPRYTRVPNCCLNCRNVLKNFFPTRNLLIVGRAFFQFWEIVLSAFRTVIQGRTVIRNARIH